MPRFNNISRPEVVQRLAERDGPCCMGCLRKFMSLHDVKVDHIDGNPRHNCISNLQLLCNSCNIKKSKYQALIFKEYPEFATNWMRSFIDLEVPSSGHSLSARPSVCVYVNDSARAGMFALLLVDGRRRADVPAPLIPEVMSDRELDAIDVEQAGLTGAVEPSYDVGHRHEFQRNRDNATPSQLVSNWAWPRYKFWALLLWHLGYDLSYEVITSTISADMDIKHGTIKNHYIKTLCAPISGLFCENVVDKLAGYERNPEVREEEEELLIKAIIEEWTRHAKSAHEFRQKYDRYHIKRLAKIFEMDDDRLMELVIARLIQAPVFR